MKKLYIIPVLVILAMTLATAAVTWVTPGQGSNHSSAITFHVTYVNASDITINNGTHAGQNSSLWYNLSSAGGAWTEVALSTLGFSDNGSDITFVLPITTLADANYTFNVTLTNNSMDTPDFNLTLSSSALTDVIIDDTAPVATLTLRPSEISVGRTVEYSFKLEDTTSKVMSGSCTVGHPDGTITSLTSVTYAIAKGTAVAPISFTDTRDEGIYHFNCSITDYAGNSVSTQKNVSVEFEGSYAPYILASQKSNTIIILVILGIIAWFVLKKK